MFVFVAKFLAYTRFCHDKIFWGIALSLYNGDWGVSIYMLRRYKVPDCQASLHLNRTRENNYLMILSSSWISEVSSANKICSNWSPPWNRDFVAAAWLSNSSPTQPSIFWQTTWEKKADYYVVKGYFILVRTSYGASWSDWPHNSLFVVRTLYCHRNHEQNLL